MHSHGSLSVKIFKTLIFSGHPNIDTGCFNDLPYEWEYNSNPLLMVVANKMLTLVISYTKIPRDESTREKYLLLR